MMISSCPRCARRVTIPAGAEPTARVRCPLCEEEYTLADVLEQLPPALVLLDAPQEAAEPEAEGAEDEDSAMFAFMAEETSSETTAVEEEAADRAASEDKEESPDEAEAEHAPFSLAEPVDVDSAAAFDFGEPTEDDASAATTAGARPKRRKRRQMNVAAEIVKVALGGVAAVIIFHGIAWWALGMDPLEVAPKLPGFLSFLAPASLRNTAAPGETTENGKADNGAPKQGRDTRRGNHKTGTAAADDGGRGGALADAAAHFQRESDNGAKDAGENQSLQGGHAGAATDSGGKEIASNGSGNPVGPSTGADLSGQLPPDDGFLGVRGAPKFSVDRLNASLKEAKAAAGRLDAVFDEDSPLDKDARTALGMELYENFCDLAHVVTFIDPNEEGMPETLEDLKKTFLDLGADPDKFSMFAILAARRLDDRNRAGSGILLAGVVEEIQLQGPLFETQITLSDRSKRVVSVYSKRNPIGAYQAGSKVLALGEIVASPAKNLGGYSGDDPSVVWGGYPVTIGD